MSISPLPRFTRMISTSKLRETAETFLKCGLQTRNHYTNPSIRSSPLNLLKMSSEHWLLDTFDRIKVNRNYVIRSVLDLPYHGQLQKALHLFSKRFTEEEKQSTASHFFTFAASIGVRSDASEEEVLLRKSHLTALANLAKEYPPIAEKLKELELEEKLAKPRLYNVPIRCFLSRQNEAYSPHGSLYRCFFREEETIQGKLLYTTPMAQAILREDENEIGRLIDLGWKFEKDYSFLFFPPRELPCTVYDALTGADEKMALMAIDKFCSHNPVQYERLFHNCVTHYPHLAFLLWNSRLTGLSDQSLELLAQKWIEIHRDFHISACDYSDDVDGIYADAHLAVLKKLDSLNSINDYLHSLTQNQ